MSTRTEQPPGRPPVAEGLALALDVGGTFTDVILADRRTGHYWITKSPSAPSDPSEGFFEGVDKVLAIARRTPREVATTFHGTTVATNAVLESKGARAALITTAGFRHVLEIGRADIPRHENLFGWVKPRRPVPPRDISRYRSASSSTARSKRRSMPAPSRSWPCAFASRATRL